jgi:membrane protein implicated in regulation of membrane protease activity
MNVKWSNRATLASTILTCLAGIAAAVGIPAAGIAAAVLSLAAYGFSRKSGKALEQRIDRLQNGEDIIVISKPGT